jgi:site-specific recombinase XerD
LRFQIASTSQALFLNASGARLATQGIANIISQFRKDVGNERQVMPHMLRHTVATLLLRNGVDIRVVQEFLGHASIAATQRYTHVSKDHLVQVLRDAILRCSLEQSPDGLSRNDVSKFAKVK